MKQNLTDCLSEISTQYKRLIDIVNSYEGAVLKFVELPIICTQSYNKSQGNAESLSVDKKISGWVRSINLYIRELNRDLNQNTLHFSADCVRNRKGSDLQPRYSVKASVLEDHTRSQGGFEGFGRTPLENQQALLNSAF